MKKEKLVLNLKKEYFDDIKCGNKKFEYRERKPYWVKRLSHDYDFLEIRLGYPSKEEKDKILKFKWNGFIEENINHKEFGKEDIAVFSIILSERID